MNSPWVPRSERVWLLDQQCGYWECSRNRDSQTQVYRIKYLRWDSSLPNGGARHEALEWMTASSLLACLRVLGHRKVEQIPQRKRQKLRLNLGRSTPQPALLAFTELPLALFSAQEIEYLYCKTHRGGWLTSHRLALRTMGKLRQQTSNFTSMQAAHQMILSWSVA